MYQFQQDPARGLHRRHAVGSQQCHGGHHCRRDRAPWRDGQRLLLGRHRTVRRPASRTSIKARSTSSRKEAIEA